MKFFVGDIFLVLFIHIVANGRVAVDFRTEVLQGNATYQIPDGMKLDTEGKLWVASNGGSAIIRFDPEYVLIACRANYYKTK